MATAPILDPTSLYRQPTKPNVRIAYTAPTATGKVAAAVDKLPTEVRAMTLDELTIASQTVEVIRTAKELLSPAFYSAFLHWGESASRLTTSCDDDDEVDRLSDVATGAAVCLADMPTANAHDLVLKTFVFAINSADCSHFGPLVPGTSATGPELDTMTVGLIAALQSQSPLVRALNDLAQTAKLLSDEDTYGFSPAIGAAVSGTFAAARNALSAGEDALLLSAFAGCQRQMIDWKVNPEQSRQDEEASIERVDGYEMTLLNSRATTLPGVIAKLRVAFKNMQDEAWSDYAVGDPSDPEFVEGLRLAGMYERMFWGAIEELAAVGGIDLGAESQPADPHRRWFEERNVLLRQADSVPDLDDPQEADEVVKTICDEKCAVEDRILSTPPTTLDGLLVQLIQATQLSVEGYELDSSEAVKMIRNAQQIVGLGTLDGAAFPEDLA